MSARKGATFSERRFGFGCGAESGMTQDFILRRRGESRPRSIRLAVLLDKLGKRRVLLEPDYFGFPTASNNVWVSYGLPASNGAGRNQKMAFFGNEQRTQEKWQTAEKGSKIEVYCSR